MQQHSPRLELTITIPIIYLSAWRRPVSQSQDPQLSIATERFAAIKAQGVQMALTVRCQKMLRNLGKHGEEAQTLIKIHLILQGQTNVVHVQT